MLHLIHSKGAASCSNRAFSDSNTVASNCMSFILSVPLKEIICHQSTLPQIDSLTSLITPPRHAMQIKSTCTCDLCFDLINDPWL